MSDQPIDVLLPVREARETLAEALGDVLGQRGVAVRVLAVVDVPADGPDDGSRAWLHARAAVEPRLVVLRGPGAGAAAALDAALSRCRAAWVAHMEADDRCDPDRLATLLATAEASPDVDAVTSQVEQFGATTPGMARYLAWQNGLLTHAAMEAERFVEIPALHQTGLYRREALLRAGGYRTRGPWPVDIDFWFRWFEAGLTVTKVPRALYCWRQHARQSTRGGGHHDLDALRAAKLDALARIHGPAGTHPRPVRLVSTGRTRLAWDMGLTRAGIELAESCSWRPGEPAPPCEDDALLLAVYGMPSVRDALRRALGHPREPDQLLFSA